MEKNQKRAVFITTAVLILIAATIAAFATSGKISLKSKTAKQNTSISSTALPTTTTTTTQPTTVDSKGSTDSVKKLVALCFDDGPSSKTTQKLIDGLKSHNAHATFFVLGENIKGNESILKSAVDSGSEIGIHGYTHKTFSSLGLAKTKAEIENTASLIVSATGKKPTHIRPPEGSYTAEIQKTISDMGYDIILWNVDTLDWKTRNASSVYSQVVSNGADGGDILCVHDIYSTTVEGTLSAIDDLQKKGYKFVTISELENARDKFVAGRKWFSAHEFYNCGDTVNAAKAVTQVTDAQGNTEQVQNGTTDVAITWPSSATTGSAG